MVLEIVCTSVEKTIELGSAIGQRLRGGEVFELLSDLGGGKTTFVRGLVTGFGSEDPVASPSFTISYVYGREDKQRFYHFDFYRLAESGIVGNELAEALVDRDNIVAIEWGNPVYDILPEQRITVSITAKNDTERIFSFEYPVSFAYLFSVL